VIAIKKLPPHRNLPLFKGSSKSDLKGSIVFEYLPFPSLKTFLDENGALNACEAMFVVRQLVRCLSAHLTIPLPQLTLLHDSWKPSPTLSDMGYAIATSNAIIS